MLFKELGLAAELCQAVSSQGYSSPTAIQSKAIPLVLRGGDLLAGAQTGTGKTAAFTLPLLQRLYLSESTAPKRRAPRALVLTPTRELAAQISESVNDYGANLPLRSTVIFGGVNINPQTAALRRGVDIVIATPGRLLDHAGQKNIDLSAIEILVLDEADRMLDMGFIHDIRRILALLPQQRQNLLFSATFSPQIRKLAAGFMAADAAQVSAASRNSAATTVSQSVYRVEKGGKRALLSWLIGSGNWQQVLVFTRTKHGANRLARQLEQDGIVAAAIHGNKSQAARTKALASFKRGAVRVLVATDIAARGLDIEQLPQVVNYDLPNVSEDYVHRIGRTGRAGCSGEAVSLVSGEETKLLRDIEKLLGRKIALNEIPAAAGNCQHSASADDNGSRRPAPRRARRNSRSGNRRNRVANIQ